LNLFKAKVNKGMAELETPEILAEQAQQELESNLKKVKEALISSITNQKSLEQQIKKSKDEITTWEKRAAMSVQQNNDDVARQCLAKKQELNANIASATAQLEMQNKLTADLKAKHAEVEQQMRDFQRKKANLVARGQASDAVSKANELMSGTGGSGTAKWEQKIQEKEFKADAMRQVSGQPAGDKFEDLDRKFQVEDDLAALKQQMAPKLIVDQGPSSSTPGKTVVDDNVPMVVEEIKDDDTDKSKK
jgi:phage shock protein A